MARKCPVCGRQENAKSRPFCSERCKNVDLARWFKGAYAIPTREKPGDENGETGELDKGEKPT